MSTRKITREITGAIYRDQGGEWVVPQALSLSPEEFEDRHADFRKNDYEEGLDGEFQRIARFELRELDESAKKNPAMTRPFTALLLYPDYLAPDWPYETYLAHVEAGDTGEAIQEAKEEAYHADKKAAETPDCFYCPAVFERHHHDLP